MPSTVETSLSAVAAARAAGDAPVLADTLLRHADSLLHAGRWADASAAIDEATGLQQARGDTREEARCLRLAATLQRLQGHLDVAKTRAHTALQLAAGPIDVDVRAAHAELGEIALAQADPKTALEAFDLALMGSINPPAAWSRGRAKAQVSMGRFAAAAEDLEAAARTLQAGGHTSHALRAAVEAATAWQQARRFDRAQLLVGAARPRALATGDAEALAGLGLLSATHALEQRDGPAARRFASQAREHALASRSATPYIGAAIALSRIDELAGDLPNAYAALATGWATAGDLIGADLARSAFEPPLRGLQERCGVPAFSQARSAYERTRKPG